MLFRPMHVRGLRLGVDYADPCNQAAPRWPVPSAVHAAPLAGLVDIFYRFVKPTAALAAMPYDRGSARPIGVVRRYGSLKSRCQRHGGGSLFDACLVCDVGGGLFVALLVGHVISVHYQVTFGRISSVDACRGSLRGAGCNDGQIGIYCLPGWFRHMSLAYLYLGDDGTNFDRRLSRTSAIACPRCRCGHRASADEQQCAARPHKEQYAVTALREIAAEERSFLRAISSDSSTRLAPDIVASLP